jgi:hypothetical protein
MEEEMVRLEGERERAAVRDRNRKELEERVARMEERVVRLFDLAWKSGGAEVEGSETLLRKIAALRKENADLKKKVADRQRLIDEIQRKVGVGPDKFRPHFGPPRIDGAVVGVSRKVNLVVINVGEEDGVLIGFEFTVLRKGAFIGKLVVEKVFPRQAACRVLLDTLAESQRVNQGDRVTTQFVEGGKPRGAGVLRKEPFSEETPMPDGRVIRADVDQGYAYIDLGWVDGVRVGQRFTVFTVRKGGWRKAKGMIQVIRVEKDFSMCTILSHLHADLPMVMGDYIWNKFFVRGRKLVFVFLGKFGGEHVQYTREQLSKLIETAGHTVTAKVTPDTHYAVLGHDYKKDPAYRIVEDWRIEKVKPRDLFDAFGFGRFK